jgi:hypothetical protein
VTAYLQTRRLKSGVPQGTVLGTCLFGIHIDDIDVVVKLIDLLLKFADDCKGKKTILNYRDRQALKETLDKHCEWAETWGMAFNKDKCKIMHVGINNPSYDYYMQGTKLSTVEEEKDVGVLIHRSLKPGRQCQKSAIPVWESFISSKTTFTIGTKIFLYGSLSNAHTWNSRCQRVPMAGGGQAGIRKCPEKVC